VTSPIDEASVEVFSFERSIFIAFWSSKWGPAFQVIFCDKTCRHCVMHRSNASKYLPQLRWTPHLHPSDKPHRWSLWTSFSFERSIFMAFWSSKWGPAFQVIFLRQNMSSLHHASNVSPSASLNTALARDTNHGGNLQFNWKVDCQYQWQCSSHLSQFINNIFHMSTPNLWTVCLNFWTVGWFVPIPENHLHGSCTSTRNIIL
jgi:hypothetical protein